MKGREIKFRAWDKEDGMLFPEFEFLSIDSFSSHRCSGKIMVTFHQPNEYHWKEEKRLNMLRKRPKDYHFSEEGNKYPYREDPDPDFDNLIWMRYTGLKDKKRTKEYPEGQDIYDGDILKDLGEVMWGKYGDHEYVDHIECWIAGKDFPISDWDTDLHGHRRVELEIIGNIYENPKLLKQ